MLTFETSGHRFNPGWANIDFALPKWSGTCLFQQDPDGDPCFTFLIQT